MLLRLMWRSECGGIFDEEQAFLAAQDTVTQYDSSMSGGRLVRYPSQQILTGLRLYPNPTSDVLNIEFETEGVLELYDITNRHLMSIPLNASSDGKASVSVVSIPAGVCICRYYVNGSLQDVRKITVLHGH